MPPPPATATTSRVSSWRLGIPGDYATKHLLQHSPRAGVRSPSVANPVLGPTGAPEHGYSDGEEFDPADLTRVDGTYSDIESDVGSDSGSDSGSGMRTLSRCGTRRSDGCGHNDGVRSVDEIIASVKRETEQKAAHEGKQQKRQIMRRQRQRQPRHLREGDEQEDHESESPHASSLPQPEFDLSGI